MKVYKDIAKIKQMFLKICIAANIAKSCNLDFNFTRWYSYANKIMKSLTVLHSLCLCTEQFSCLLVISKTAELLDIIVRQQSHSSLREFH